MSLCFDITQFVSAPTASGIQRVLREIARRTQDDDLFGVIDGGCVHLIHPSAAVELLETPFVVNGQVSSLTQTALRESHGRVSLRDIAAYCEAYVFAELTYSLELLKAWSELEAGPAKTGAIFYDALPETNRSLIGSQPPFGSGEYFRFVSRLDRVACISHAAREELSTISRRPAADFTVAPLGADHFPRNFADSDGHFVVIGDLRKKKRVVDVVRAFQSVASATDRLIIIGRAIEGADDERDFVDGAASANEGIEWLSNATDDQIEDCLRRAQACLFIARNEGYGLPAVEALQLGVPVVVAADLPCVRYLNGSGVLALGQVDEQSIGDAITRFGGPDGAAARSAARELVLPSWSDHIERLRSLFQR